MDEFLKQIRDDHHEFNKGKPIDHVDANPFSFFERWYKQAFSANENEPNAMVLSTVDENHKPDSRILYLKELENEKFVFFTNYQSKKGQDLDSNPHAGLLFFWPTLQRQIRIDGIVEKTSEAVSDAYFASRPRESQLGAWASHQSEMLSGREELENRLEKLHTRFPNEVPRPPHWGGYALKPQRFEFWQGRPSRLHDRIAFERQDIHWQIFRLNP